jgi:hypothetical protein
VTVWRSRPGLPGAADWALALAVAAAAPVALGLGVLALATLVGLLPVRPVPETMLALHVAGAALMLSPAFAWAGFLVLVPLAALLALAGWFGLVPALAGGALAGALAAKASGGTSAALAAGYGTAASGLFWTVLRLRRPDLFGRTG